PPSPHEMKIPKSIFSIILISSWFGVILFLNVKEAGVENRIIKSSGMKLVQGGCYEMGDPFGNGMADEQPVHMVCVDPFYLGNELVTVGALREFIASTGYRTDAEKSGGCDIQDGGRSAAKERNWKNPGHTQTELSPVVCVSWNDTGQFIHWLTEKSSKKGIGYRLPTEGEWEFAARNRGEKIPPNFSPDKTRIFHRVEGSKEWIQDRYGADYYSQGDKTNPAGPSLGKFRVLRGDPFLTEPGKSGLFSRFWKEQDYASSKIGFRLALSMTDR
ncbi:MAG: formylglycine-generating enzyme family protein, partial [Syntrophales bacterium LBB04]|nr:formylglycine-generating enzyme family protein [Syntrophales bacterium LBB04]